MAVKSAGAGRASGQGGRSGGPIRGTVGNRAGLRRRPPHRGVGGTPRRPSRPTTTWPSNSAGSSSPPDFAVHAPSRPPRKKPGPSSQPGPPPGL